MTPATVENRPVKTDADQPTRKPGWFGRILGALLFSLGFSIVLEWIGIAFFRPELGADHSADMMVRELGYLNADFRQGLLDSSPSRIIQNFAGHAYYYLFQWTMIEDLVRWIGEATGLYQYALAATFTIQLFFIRLGVLTFSMPVYGLFALVGASTGLSMRDIRRWSGGREYGRVYHKAKALAPKALVVAWILYLSLPESLHPNLVILPCALLFGLNVLVVTASFKKYL